jgi:hypothetical protein
MTSKSTAAIEDDPRISEILSPEEISLARFVANSYPEYFWAQRLLRNFTPEEHEELRKESERVLRNPAVQCMIAEEAERRIAAQP